MTEKSIGINIQPIYQSLVRCACVCILHYFCENTCVLRSCIRSLPPKTWQTIQVPFHLNHPDNLHFCLYNIQVVGTLYTHHQKCVIVDTQASGNNRKVSAFLGGLDLCDGRYDTPEHRLFRDLDTVFKDDFHNPTFSVSIFHCRPLWWEIYNTWAVHSFSNLNLPKYYI